MNLTLALEDVIKLATGGTVSIPVPDTPITVNLSLTFAKTGVNPA